MAPPMTCPSCGSQNIVLSPVYVDSQGRQFRLAGKLSGCLIVWIILIVVVVLVEGVTFALTAWPNGWSRIGMTLGAAVGPLLALVAVSRFHRTVQYRCRHCQHHWLSAAHRLLSGPEDLPPSERLAAINDVQHADPLTVNALLQMLDDREAATREAAARKLRGMLDQLDDLPATRAGVERALHDYEQAHH